MNATPVTLQQVEQVFAKWDSEWQSNPNSFVALEDASPKAQAEHFMRLLEEVRKETP